VVGPAGPLLGGGAGGGAPAAGVPVHGGRRLLGVGSRQQHRLPGWLGEELGDDGRALVGRLTRRVDGLQQTLSQRAMVVDPREADISEGQAAQPGHGVVGIQRTGPDVVEEAGESRSRP